MALVHCQIHAQLNYAGAEIAKLTSLHLTHHPHAFRYCSGACVRAISPNVELLLSQWPAVSARSSEGCKSYIPG
jgi:hypothetical protein